MKKWNGERPTACDVCNKPIERAFVDGKTTGGPWAIMCLECHDKHGFGLGVGRGQKYSADTRVKIDPDDHVANGRDELVEALRDMYPGDTVHVAGTSFSFTAGPAWREYEILNSTDVWLINTKPRYRKRSNMGIRTARVARTPKKLW